MTRKPPIKKNKEIVSYIGIDFSLLNPAVSIKYGQEHITHVFDFGRYSKKHPIVRNELISTNIIEYIKKYIDIRKALFVIEDYAPGGKGKTNAIAEACGLLKHKLYLEEVPVQQIKLCLIQHGKMFISSNGTAKKELILKDVFKYYGFDTTDNNEADAFVMSQICFSYFVTDRYKELTSYQKDIINRIKKYNADS